MADLQELLASISDEDMAKIKGVASSIMNGNGENKAEVAPAQSNFSLPFDAGTMSKIMSVMGKMNKENYRTRLINDLKPLLSEERRKKADDAIRFLQLMEVLPLLKGMFTE